MAKLREVAVAQLLAPASRTATANGTGVDLQSYTHTQGHEYAANLQVGAVTGTTPTLDVKVQESDDNSSFSDISGATFAQKTAAGEETIYFRSVKRYVRLVATIGGTSPVFPSCATLLATKRLV